MHTQAPAAWPSARTGWTATALLTVGFVFSYVDRQVISILAPLVKADLRLTDLELSLLLGLSFALPFAFCGLICGWLADRIIRTRLIAAALAFWSLMTALCGFSTGFWSLFLARIGVGVGEAAMNPAAVSLISDQFPPERRARPLALYNMGTTIGITIAFVAVGALVPKTDLSIPGLGTLRPWQIVFVALGLPGLLYALALLAIREPVRRGIAAGTGATYGEALAFLCQRWRLFLPLFIGFALLGLLVYGPASQTVLFVTRTFGWSIPQTAKVNGLVLLLSAVPGAIYGGWLASRLRQRGRADGTLRAVFYNTTGMVLPMALAFVTIDLLPRDTAPLFFWILAAVQNFFVASSINLGSACIADVTPNQFRGKVIAIYSLILTLIGLGLGPTIIAFLTDRVIGDEQLIRYSLTIFAALFGPLAVFAFGVALPFFRKVVVEADGWTGTR